MSNRVTITLTIDLPDGVVPGVEYGATPTVDLGYGPVPATTAGVDERDTAPMFEPPLPAPPPAQLFPPFPQAPTPTIPVCPIHQKALVYRAPGIYKSGPKVGQPRPAFWSCAEKDANGNWCQSRQDAA